MTKAKNIVKTLGYYWQKSPDGHNAWDRKFRGTFSAGFGTFRYIQEDYEVLPLENSSIPDYFKVRFLRTPHNPIFILNVLSHLGDCEISKLEKTCS